MDRHALSREAYKAYATIREYAPVVLLCLCGQLMVDSVHRRGVAELAQVWEERPRQALDVELAAPTIIIPQDSSSPTKPILIANLGTLRNPENRICVCCVSDHLLFVL